MQEDGADIIDVGGESTRPGTEPIGAREELARVLPVVKGLAKQVRVPISVDTYRADVARAVIGEGASIINDISGLRYDPALAGRRRRGRERRARAHAHARSIEGDVRRGRLRATSSRKSPRSCEASMAVATAAGVALERADRRSGLGFAKQPDDSYGVLARLPALAAALDRPVLVGPSRKSFMREALGGRPRRSATGERRRP